MPVLIGEALNVVLDARVHALRLHGPLKPGPERWSRLLQEEMQEVEDEFASMVAGDVEARARAIGELAQLAQLAIGVIEMIQQGRVYDVR